MEKWAKEVDGKVKDFDTKGERLNFPFEPYKKVLKRWKSMGTEFTKLFPDGRAKLSCSLKQFFGLTQGLCGKVKLDKQSTKLRNLFIEYGKATDNNALLYYMTGSEKDYKKVLSTPPAKGSSDALILMQAAVMHGKIELLAGYLR